MNSNSDKPILLDTRRYQPHVLAAGAHNSYKGKRRVGRPSYPGPYAWYTFHAVSDGFITWEENDESHKVSGPAVVVRLPGEFIPLGSPPSCHCTWVDFGVMAKPLTERNSGEAMRYVKNVDQPSPTETWGIPLPRVLPTALHQDTFRTIMQIDGLWWRSTLMRRRADGLLMALLSSIIHEINSTERAVFNTELARRASTDTAKRVLQIFELHISKGLTVKTWAELAKLSERQLYRIIQQGTGLSPKLAMELMQMELAKDLLTTTDKSIQRIAKTVGTTSRPVFSRLFKKHFNTTPAKWRESNRFA